MKRRVAGTVLVLCMTLCAYAGGLRVVFIGDSITDGNWGNAGGRSKPSSERNHTDMNHIYGSGYMYLCASYYQSAYPGREYEFFNRGISGNTLENLEARWQQDVVELAPDVLSVLVGTNDIHHYLQQRTGEPFDFEGWERRYRSLLDRARAANPEVRIVLGAPFVVPVGKLRGSDDFALRAELVGRCAAIVKRIAADYGAVYLPYDELFERLLRKEATSKETYWIWDGIHPTPAGHRRMAELWIRRVRL